MKTLIYILATWLVLNAILPLFLNSIERLYQKNIDAFVQTSLHIVVLLMLSFIQIVLIAFFAPNILLMATIERLWPAFFKISFIEKSGAYSAMQLLLKRDAWSRVGKRHIYSGDSISTVRRRNYGHLFYKKY